MSTQTKIKKEGNVVTIVLGESFGTADKYNTALSMLKDLGKLELDMEKASVWPQEGQTVYMHSCATKRVEAWAYNKELEPLSALGRLSRTPEEALKKYKLEVCRTRIDKKVEELNKGWMPDWSDKKPKYGIRHEHLSSCIGLSQSTSIQECQWYLKSVATALVLMDALEEEIRYVFGISNDIDL